MHVSRCVMISTVILVMVVMMMVMMQMLQVVVGDADASHDDSGHHLGEINECGLVI